MKTVFWPVLAAVVLSACSTGDFGVESPYYRYPEGGRLVLNRALEIPAGAATVRLQSGQPVARNAVQERAPYCVFEIDTVSDGPQIVEPASFAIVDVWREVRDVSAAVRYETGLMSVGFGGDGGPSHLYYKTVFRLRGAGQPAVRRLVCESDQLLDPLRQPLTLAEMRSALGEWFSFRFPAPDVDPALNDAPVRTGT